MEENKFRKYSGDYLLTMLKEKKIRKGNLIVLYSLEEDEEDYYLVTDKDIVMLVDNSVGLFNNIYILDFIKKWEFSVIFNDEEKKKIISRVLSDNT